MIRHFRSADRRYGLELPVFELSRMLNSCMKAGKEETGGLLIGHYTDDLITAVVEAATDAPDDSKAGKSWFHRGIRGVNQYLREFWKEQRYFLGEWHFHPFAAPNPSGTDVSYMAKIASTPSNQCARPILLIIGGDPAGSFNLRVFAFVDGKMRVELNQI